MTPVATSCTEFYLDLSEHMDVTVVNVYVIWSNRALICNFSFFFFFFFFFIITATTVNVTLSWEKDTRVHIVPGNPHSWDWTLNLIFCLYKPPVRISDAQRWGELSTWIAWIVYIVFCQPDLLILFMYFHYKRPLKSVCTFTLLV